MYIHTVLSFIFGIEHLPSQKALLLLSLDEHGTFLVSGKGNQIGGNQRWIIANQPHKCRYFLHCQSSVIIRAFFQIIFGNTYLLSVTAYGAEQINKNKKSTERKTSSPYNTWAASTLNSIPTTFSWPSAQVMSLCGHFPAVNFDADLIKVFQFLHCGSCGLDS